MSRCGTCNYVEKYWGKFYCTYHKIYCGEFEQACDDYKDGCFIATAVLSKTDIYDKPEGIEILNALVLFRDDYLVNSPKGRFLLGRYVVLGKQIAQAVSQADADLSEGIRKVFLEPIVSKIHLKDYEAAEKLYTYMVRFLQIQFRM